MDDGLALAVVHECRRAGVAEFCVCAGSRNSELVRLLVAAEARCWHFFEERSAAFFALGRARVLGRPVAVVTTSGTAAVEIFPAIVEAHYQGLPLLAITADRPPAYRHSGAPQAINQENLFGGYPEIFVDLATTEAAAEALENWTQQAPAHLNICLGEPPKVVTFKEAGPAPSRHLKELTGPAAPSPWTADLVLLGDLLPAEQAQVKSLLADWHGPVWAEAASGLRGWLGPRLVRGGEGALRQLSVRSVLRLGGVPSCRYWRDLEQRPDVAVCSVSRAPYPGLARFSTLRSWGEISLTPTAHAFTDLRLDDLWALFPLSECSLLHALSQRIPPGSTLFLGNSLAIRQWNLAAIPSAVESHCHVMRGANGIDGNLSFFYGTAAAAAEAWAIVGDLTALYDLAAPWILPQLPAGRRRIVVMNNGGGHIFRRLPALQGLTAAEQALIENPHDVRLAHWAALWKMDYLLVTALADWPAELPPGDVVIEIIPDCAQSQALWQAFALRERETFP